MTLASRIAHNSIISAITRIASLGLALVTVGLITRYLGTSGFGVYTTITAFYFLIAALSDFGINQILTREISRPKADEKKILANVLGLRIVSLVVISTIGAGGVFLLPYAEEVRNGIWLMFLALVFSSTSQTLNSIFQKRLVMHKLSYRELVGRIIQLGLTYLAVKNDWGVLGVLLSMIGSYLFILIASLELARKYIPISLALDKKYWRYFALESAPLGAAAFVNFLYFKADAILLSLLRDNHDVGIYGAAYKVLESLIYFPFMFMGLIMPVFSYNIFHRPEKFLLLASRTLKAVWLVTIPLVIFVFFLSQEAIKVIAGAGFEESVKVLRILAFALGAIFLAHFFNSVLIASNKQKLLLFILASTAGLSLILNVIFIPRYSYMAAAIISTICEILVTLIAYYLSRKWGIGWGKGWKKMPVFSFTISAIGMVAVMFVLQSYEFSLIPSILLKGGLGAVTYVTLIFLTKGLKIDELKQVITVRGLRSNDGLNLPN